MPQEPSSWLGAGLAALAEKRLAEAEDALGRARFATADVATAAAYGLVLVAVQRGDRDAFRERGTAFVDRFPRHPAVPALMYGLAAAALERKDFAGGQAWTQRLLREHAASDLGTHALLRLAAAAAEPPARPDVARQAYRDLLARSTATEIRAEASFGLAEAALAAGDGGEAQRAAEGFLREVPAGDPRAAQAHLVLVRALEAQGQRDRAVTAIEGFLRQFPRDAASPALELQRGRLLFEARRWDAAQQAFEGARRADDPRAGGRGGVLARGGAPRAGRARGGVSAYLAATYAYPDSPWAARGLQGAAQAFVARQMPRDAAIVLRKLAARPGVDPALAQWAREALAQPRSRAGPPRRRRRAGPRSPRRSPDRPRAALSGQLERVVEGADGQLHVLVLDDAGHRDLRGRDHVDVDPLPGERPEHPGGDARVAAHPDADDGDLRDAVVGGHALGADLLGDLLERG